MWTVTPYAGVWIEIARYNTFYSRVNVTPYAGVWIEIFFEHLISDFVQVTPYAGVWIEIKVKNHLRMLCQSLPTRECGLKY